MTDSALEAHRRVTFTIEEDGTTDLFQLSTGEWQRFDDRKPSGPPLSSQEADVLIRVNAAVGRPYVMRMDVGITPDHFAYATLVALEKEAE